MVEPWHPVHIAGPDRGTTHCPICTYLHRPAVVIFAKDGHDVATLAKRLERLTARQRRNELKGFLVVTNATKDRLHAIAKKAKVTQSGLCAMNPKTQAGELKAYRIHPEAANTIMIYQDYKVVATFVNVSAKEFGKVESAANGMLE